MTASDRFTDNRDGRRAQLYRRFEGTSRPMADLADDIPPS
jgi:hypothetical protein